MTVYLILKSLVMLAALVLAFGYFFKRVTRLYRIMMAVDGEPKLTPELAKERLKERLNVILTDILGQANVRRKKAPGIAHTLIFFGFLAIQPHSLELMIQGICPAFHIGYLVPGLYTAYLFIADILGFFVLVGFAYALYRRLVIKPDYLTMGRDANLIILFTSVIVLTFHFINAFTIVMTPPEVFNYAAALPVSGIFAAVFGIAHLGQADLFVGYEFFYYLHIGTILGFLIYIPSSKHLHLLAAAPNVYFKRLETEKAMIRTDIEDEDAETFGLGKCSEFNWHNVLNLYACTECGRCEELCPAASTGKPLSPKKIIHDFKVDLLDQAHKILPDKEGSHKKDEVTPLMTEGSEVTEDVLWSCTTCRSCENICPVSNEHLDFVFEMRKHQVLMEASFPPEMAETFNNMENQANPWGFAADTRADWAKDLDVPLMMDKPDAKVLYFVGCAGSFDDRGKKISRATARVLKKAGVDFAILGPEESCNGDMARRAGNEYLGQMMIQQNVETINQYTPELILTGCPHCYNTLKNEYPEFGADYEVVHYADYFKTLIDQGKLKVKAKDLGNITFHDSCYLGRWNDIYESPRDLLTQANTGELVEMDRTGEKGFCCGAGGARMFMEETIGERINNVRAQHAVDTGADIVAASCPFCATMLNDGIMETDRKMQVLDIAEIIDEVTES
ncbi:MAG: 4Fe-4S dicluster domain-containing protein [Desulfobacterales bacterium]|nr:4Fe-4S dicluster domain-containing protein [Desulfobacterales bacterium]